MIMKGGGSWENCGPVEPQTGPLSIEEWILNMNSDFRRNYGDTLIGITVSDAIFKRLQHNLGIKMDIENIQIHSISGLLLIHNSHQ